MAPRVMMTPTERSPPKSSNHHNLAHLAEPFFVFVPRHPLLEEPEETSRATVSTDIVGE